MIDWNQVGKKSGRLPIIQQASVAECGLACLAMVASFHGLSIDLHILRSRYATSLRGMSFHDIYRTAAKLNLAGRGVRVTPAGIHKINLPAILHWDANHFVVLKRITRKHAVIHDPSCGVRRLEISELSRHFEGYALEFFPTPNFYPGAEKSSANISQLFSKIPGLGVAFIKVAILAFSLEVFSNLMPLYTQWIVDEVLVSSDINLLKVLLFCYLFVVAFQSITSTLRSWVFLRFGTQLNIILQVRVFSHLLKLPLNYFETRESSDVISRFYSLTAIQQVLTGTTVETLIDGVMGIIVGIIIFSYNANLSMIAVGFLAIYALLRWLRYYPFRDSTMDQITAGVKLQSHFLETIRGARGIKLFDKTTIRTNQWLKLLYNSTNAQLKIGYLGINYGEFGTFLSSVERAIILYFGAQSVLEGRMSIGYLLAFLTYKDLFVLRIDRLIQKIVDISLLKLQVDRLKDIVSTGNEDDTELPYLASGEIEASISLENIGFRYSPQDEWIFRGISIAVNPGEHVCIVGRSGIGKSTIIKLISGLMRPEEGIIRIGGVPIEQLGKQARAFVASIMQDDHLYTGTILENVTFFDLTPDLEWAEKCTKLAEVHDEILAMKMGYNSLVGDMGSSLSGGQKQRVLLARALYAKPRILILDESTSDLDVALERKIAKNISSLNITRLSIAHRPDTIKSADRIVDLSELLTAKLVPA